MILKSMGVECKKDDMDGYAGEVEEEALDHIIEEVDEDGSGTMDFDEFQEMMMG